MLALVFLNATPAGKLGLVVAGFLVIGLGTFFLPKSLLHRYITMTTREQTPENLQEYMEGMDDNLRTSAVDSSASRLAVLKESVRLTLARPLTGVGPGMFALAVAESAKERGKHVVWLETHNSYTQVSSECGLPALAFYTMTLLSCLLGTTSIYRKFRNRKDPRHAEIAATAFALRSSLLAFAVTAMFASVAYQGQLPTLAGLTVAFMASVRGDLKQLQTAPSVRRHAVAQPVRQPWTTRPAARVKA
jgi:O-antigen ligase